MPNELKPEDVMRALDILDKMDFFQGQRAGRELWSEKPFEVQEQDIADFSQGIEVVKNLITNALALLRDKDAEIEKLNIEIEALKIANEKMYVANKAQESEIERLEAYNKELDNLCNLMHRKLDEGYAEFANDERSEAITEFAERVKEKKINLGTIPVVCVESIDEIAEKLKG